MASFTIRSAEPVDAEAVTRMHLQAWREAYGHLLSADFFAAAEARVPAQVEQRRARFARGPGAMIAVDGDGAVVGVAHAGAAQGEDAPAGRELYLIYALRHVHGSGVGQALLDGVLGAAPAFLWVLEDNPRAQAFYRRNGFEPDGTRTLLPDEWENLPEIRMVRGVG